MVKILDSFKDENENYIIIPIIREFMNGKENMKVSCNRRELLTQIENYADSVEKEQEIDVWIQKSIKEGIKDLYIGKIQLEKNKKEQYLVEKNLQKIFAEKDLLLPKKSFNQNKYSKELKIVNYTLEDGFNGNVLTIYFAKKIFVSDQKSITRVRTYPILIEIYFDKGLIIGRAKSKVNMYEYSEKGFNEKTAEKLTTEKEIKDAIEYIEEILKIKKLINQEVEDYFKERIYLLLDKYTQTPRVIEEKLGKYENYINSMSKEIMNLCEVPNSVYDDIQFDVRNTFEKYISIYIKDKGIFKQNAAYPLKLSATDEEKSKVQQIAAEELPLQSKALFFDNKKMLQKNKKCDGVTFVFKRKFNIDMSDSFKAIIGYKNNYCTVKFKEYVREGDILNVVFSIIGTE